MIKMYTFECLYDEIVTSCALLISTVSNEQVNDGFEQILIEATLIDDARHMSILMDIWILFLRYDEIFENKFFHWIAIIFLCFYQ